MKYSKLKEKLKKEDFVRTILYKLIIKEEELERYKRDYLDKKNQKELLDEYFKKKKYLTRKIIQVQTIFARINK